MDAKQTREIFIILLGAALLVHFVGMVYILSDLEQRLGNIEHYIAHHVYGGGLDKSCGKMDRPWQKYERDAIGINSEATQSPD